MKKKILFTLISIFMIILFVNGVHAASASITASKTSVTVGTKVTITVKVSAAAWNLNVSGATSDSIVGFNMEAQNETTTKTYAITPSKAGTYTVYLKGDITDESSETAVDINKSTTITVEEKPETNTGNSNNNNGNSNNTTTTKSSNANISKLTLSVEGLSFKSSQTTYNIKVGSDVNTISVGVTLSSSKASYKVTGNKNLTAGNNVIKIVVTAEDGTTKTYKINVEKAGDIEDTSSELTNLIIENMTFTEPFNKLQTEYVGSKIKYTTKLNILPYTLSEKATYEIIGNENLKEGENTVIVKVTSYDETNTTEYKITFEMLPKEESNALQVVDSNNNEDESKEESLLKKALIDNSTIILLYLLALVEFGQVVYLYIELKKVNPIKTEYRRKRNKEDK